ncbi:TetR/AcrR family transcriptional regulator [Halarcobacter ebronensis]|uniref:TetR/AcrR family transcriptional regulator n=1 Tax=Halarcobacter ebronensis TaxID=1462615 RepID=UPI003C7835A4
MTKEEKQEKRRCMALSCLDAFLKTNYQNLTVTSLAKQSNIAKGTLYEYFKNKEDIILELTEGLYEQWKEKTQKEVKQKENLKDKFEFFFTMVYTKEFKNYRTILNIFAGLSHYEEEETFKNFLKKIYEEHLEVINSLVEEGIKQELFIKEARNLTRGLLNSFIGFFHISLLNEKETTSIEEIRSFLKNFFITIEKAN